MPTRLLRQVRKGMRFGALLALFVLTFCAGLLYTQSALQVPSGTFAPTGAMAGASRNAGSAALLADGRILITDGSGASGALASAEFFSGGAFAAAPAMATADRAALRHEPKVLVKFVTCTPLLVSMEPAQT